MSNEHSNPQHGRRRVLTPVPSAPAQRPSRASVSPDLQLLAPGRHPTPPVAGSSNVSSHFYAAYEERPPVPFFASSAHSQAPTDGFVRASDSKGPRSYPPVLNGGSEMGTLGYSVSTYHQPYQTQHQQPHQYQYQPPAPPPGHSFGYAVEANTAGIAALTVGGTGAVQTSAGGEAGYSAPYPIVTDTQGNRYYAMPDGTQVRVPVRPPEPPQSRSHSHRSSSTSQGNSSRSRLRILQRDDNSSVWSIMSQDGGDL